jgi:anti-anti-sigma factor
LNRYPAPVRRKRCHIGPLVWEGKGSSTILGSRRCEIVEFEEAGLRVTSHSPGDVVVLELNGELDVASAGALDRWVSVVRPLTMPLTIDVTDLRFVDSSGLRAITAARRAAVEDTGAAVRLVGCSDMLRKVLIMSGLSEAFVGVDG